MKIFKLMWLLLAPAVSYAGTLTISQDLGGNIGSVTFVPAQQIFIDSDTSSGFKSGVGNLSWDMAIGNGSNRGMLVGCATTTGDSVSTITVGGFVMTLATSNWNALSGDGCGIFVLAAPPSGTFTIDAETASGITDRTMCWAQTYTGVNQSTPLDQVGFANNSPGGGSSTVTFVTSVAHGVILDVGADGNADTPAPAAGQTKKMVSGNSSAVTFGSYKTTSLAASYSMTWTGVNAPTVQCAASLRAAP